MKTTSSRTISTATRASVEAVLRTDPAVKPAHLRAILRSLDTPPGETVDLLTATEAAQRLGVSVVTVQRWIENGKLDGFRIGQRTTAATVAGVEAMKRHLEKNPLPKPKPSDPLPIVDRSAAVPLPDRLAHLATVAKTAKTAPKSRRG